MTYLTEVEQLRIARIARRKTQAEVAAVVGKTQEWLSQVERGIIRTDSYEISRLHDLLRPQEILNAF
jgi:transcriptional regulator with XRE-family HTH domain